MPEGGVPVQGSLSLKDGKGEGRAELVTHLLEQGPLTNLHVSLLGSHEANIEGSAIATLAGEHTGLKWGGLPG